MGAVLAEWLKQQRGVREWSQDDLAREAGITQPRISRIEAGKTMPNGATARRLSRALGVHVSVMMGQVVADIARDYLEE